VTAGIALSQDSGNVRAIATQQRASDALSEAHRVSSSARSPRRLIAKNLSIAPTLDIRPGYRFNVDRHQAT
jgi:type IV secretory pathway VirB10-like protein